MIEVTASTDIFSKIAIIAQTRLIDLQPLFSYPVGTIPLSLAQPDGTLNKTNKVTLLHKLEGKVEPISEIEGEYAFIVDGMACVRKVKTTKMKYE